MSTAKGGLLCVSVMGDTIEDMLAAVQPVAHHADIIEVRLDSIKHPYDALQLSRFSCPVLVTNRPVWEGGLFFGCEQARIDMLCHAMQAGARYVDIELRTEPVWRDQVFQVARNQQVKILVSSHDFAGTPPLSALEALLQQMHISGADIGKIVTTAHAEEDVLRVLSLQQHARTSGLPLCAFSMGTVGRISRFATLYLGGFMTYAAVDALQATAPGQLSVEHLRAMISLFEQTSP